MESRKPQTQTIEFAGRPLVIETGKMANLSQGAVTLQYGETVILATAVMSPEPKEGADFFPFIVDYEEKLYAAGKISGSRFIKREGRPSEKAILTARMCDRPIRPLFPKKFYHDTQVIVTVLSYDGENDPDIISVIGASTALMQTAAPFAGPIGAVRVGLVDNEFVFNPTETELEKSDLDLVVVGTKEKVVMIEAGAKQVSEEKMFEAIEAAHKALQPSIDIQAHFTNPDRLVIEAETSELEKSLEEFIGKRLHEIITSDEQAGREEQIKTVKDEALVNFEGTFKQIDLTSAFDKMLEKELRNAILDKGIRPDGRKPDEIRPITVEVSVLPRVHGSGLFTRGQTQALTIATLAAPGFQQIIDTMEEEGTKHFMHHYNFPPFSTGEVRPLRSTSRREIGHGALAEKALTPVLPDHEKFPYTIRLVSEILSSNGSSSMASTCGATLALMDAGVPITEPVSGIAMGLMTRGDEKFVILTDLQGLEDFAGDMDFKIAGTKNGITAIQLDMKIKGLTMEIIQETLKQAKGGRAIILEKMLATISEPRKELSQYAPRIYTVHINPEKISELIGPGGKNIQKIIADAGGKEVVSIDVEQDGTVLVSSADSAAAEQVVASITGQTREVEVGEVFEGTVEAIQKDRMSGKEIGAIVKFLPNKDGMVHISEIANERIDTVSSRIKVGQTVKVKVVSVDRERGRIGLSIKRANEEEPKQ